MSKFSPAQIELMDRAAEQILTYTAELFAKDFTHVPPEGAVASMAKMMAMYLASWGATTADQKGEGLLAIAVYSAEARVNFGEQLDAMLPDFTAMLMRAAMEGNA